MLEEIQFEFIFAPDAIKEFYIWVMEGSRGENEFAVFDK